MNWFRVGLVAALMAALGLWLGPKLAEAERNGKQQYEDNIRRIALEQICRTLVEANLVGRCGQK